ncbi:MAG: hypothetical protein GAK33_07269 [Burkholderia lata]|uniref:Uncharacterized protein n=1 Tax=Burkholderia lata (strain ATCC 17760 / DSM 23089 / LMG 22485 / NCIMB 9086 / R18194 / 383) TaxID=482957 RepID=A0A833PLQ2_BURL3|nr:MAG: hypothetical protein GAK33_07269 [Burkholderia lata]
MVNSVRQRIVSKSSGGGGRDHVAFNLTFGRVNVGGLNLHWV